MVFFVYIFIVPGKLKRVEKPATSHQLAYQTTRYSSPQSLLRALFVSSLPYACLWAAADICSTLSQRQEDWPHSVCTAHVYKQLARERSVRCCRGPFRMAPQSQQPVTNRLISFLYARFYYCSFPTSGVMLYPLKIRPKARVIF